MTLAGLLLLAALIMKLWPETGLAHWLRASLIDQPLATLRRIKRVHLVFLIVGLGVIYSFSTAGMPHLGVAAAVDVSIYVDAMITIWTVAAFTRAKTSWTTLRARLKPPRRMNRQRARRSTAVRRVRGKPANDDDGHGWPVRAAGLRLSA